MRTQPIDPTLLKVFRLAIGVEFALALLGYLGEIGDPDLPVMFISAYVLILTGGLLVLLMSRWLQRQLGSLFLPLALIIASVGPVIGETISVAIRIHQNNVENVSQDESGTLLLWLLVPLLLISSQYRMRVMWAFTLGTAGLQLLLAWLLYDPDEPQMDFTLEEILVRLLIYGIVGYVVVRLTTAQRDQRGALAQKNIELAHYATMLEQLAVNRERNRMARELHDTLAHTLSAVSVQLGALEVLLDTEPAAARSTLHTIQEMTRQGVSEARRAMHALRASPLEDLGFTAALRSLAEKTADRAGLQLILEVPETLVNVRPDVEQHMYRIVEEALANVVRHANATAVTIRLQQCDRNLLLQIVDDGVGFDPAAAVNDGHYGLRGIVERLQLVSGDLKIESAPGRGTTLVVSIKEIA